MKFSVVIPTYNEEGNIVALYNELTAVMKKIGSYELIFVNDGSRDKTLEKLEKLHAIDKHVIIIDHARNFGQTAAFYSGFQNLSGEIVITLDADMQNNPRDLPRLLKKLDKGYDVVCGWRKHRKDPFWMKFVSKIASFARKILTNEKVHDPGCSLRVYKSSAVKDLFIYGEMHRYITTILKMKGFRVGELVVDHRERYSGKTKYTPSKVFRGLVDLLNYKFWYTYSKKPLQFFVKYGSILFFIGIALIIYNFARYGLKLTIGPTLFLSALFIISAVQFISLGLLAEMQVKTYYQENPKELATINKIYK